MSACFRNKIIPTFQQGNHYRDIDRATDRPSTATTMDCSLSSSSENSEEAEAAISVRSAAGIPLF